MRLVTFSIQGFKRIGAIYPNNVVVDLNYAYQALLESEGNFAVNKSQRPMYLQQWRHF